MLPASKGWDGRALSQTLFLCLLPDEAKCSQVAKISWPPTPCSSSFVTLFAMRAFPSQISESDVLTARHITRTGNESTFDALSCSERRPVICMHQQQFS